MRKYMFALAFSASVFSTGAFAQDWSGFYAGVHGGYGWGDADTVANADGSLVGVPSDGDGILGGVQAGINFQSGTFVWGIEADISRADIETSGFFLGDPEPSFLGPIQGASSVDGEIDWFGTLRLRAGVLVSPSALIYATGGLAYGRVENAIGGDLTFLAGPVTVPLFVGNTQTWEAGWTIGGGGEFALSENVSLRGEYLYYDLGDTSYSATPLDPNVTSVRVKSENTGHIVRAALNFKLGQ